METHSLPTVGKIRHWCPLVFAAFAGALLCCASSDPTDAAPTQKPASQTEEIAVVREPLPIGSDLAIFQESKPLVTRAGAWQTWNDHIHLEREQEKLRLILVFTNGADSRPKFTDLKVQLGRKPFATLKNFDGADVLACNLTGKFTRGNTAVTVQGFGPSGGRLNWKVYIQRPQITSITPNPASLTDKLRIVGNNFAERADHLKVLVANHPAKLVKVQNTELELKLPAHTASGSQNIVVQVHSVASNVAQVVVKGSPQVTFVNMLSSPPGQPVTLRGSGFSPVLSENIVTFARVRARLLSVTTSSITCVVPEMHFPQWHVPIIVTTNGMPSKERATINIDQRVEPNQGFPMN